MKATGIVRRIDDLGRVVIPKEIRRTMRIREGDPLEIYTTRDGEVIFKKYSLIGGLEEFAAQFCDTLSRSTDFSAAITDRDAVIAISGAGKKELLGKSVSPELEQVMTRRSLYCGDGVPVAEGNGAFRAAVAAPILCEGDVLGAVLLFVLKTVGILLLVVLVLVVMLLLCPFCADLCWEHGVLTVRAGALGITFPVFQYPKPEPPPAPENPEPPKGFGKVKAKFAAWRTERKRKKAEEKARKKAAAAASKPARPRKKAKITLEIICTMLRGAGTLMKAVFGALRITKIQVRLGVCGEDPAAAARDYGKLQAWLYPVLGVLDRFLWLQFDELRILPDFGSSQPTVEERVSCRVSAQALFIVIAALRVLYEFWRKKVLDIFL